MKKLLLASSSQSRAQVLKSTQISFESISPDIDESFHDKCFFSFIERLSKEKAIAGWKKFSHYKKQDCADVYYVLGADQVAIFKNKIYGKPKTEQKAFEFLTSYSGQSVDYLSGLALYLPQTDEIFCDITTTTLTFKKLSEKTIKQYITLDKPLFCAGAIKLESKGTALIESFKTSDPYAITGMPLMSLDKLLREKNLSLLDFTPSIALMPTENL